MMAMVSVGMFALPTVYSLQSGAQHRFQILGSAETGSVSTYCGQCHKTTDGNAIQDDIDLSDTRTYATTFGVGKIHATQTCGDCHALTSYGVGDAGTYNATAKNNAHAAEKPKCTKCHGASPVVGPNVAAELTNDMHKNFATTGSGVYDCIACHTYVTKSGGVNVATVETPCTKALGTTGISIGTGAACT